MLSIHELPKEEKGGEGGGGGRGGEDTRKYLIKGVHIHPKDNHLIEKIP